MWTYDFFQETDLPPDCVWAPLSEIESWPAFDSKIRKIEMMRPPSEGAIYYLEAFSGKRHRRRIAGFFAPSRFEDVSRLPLARVHTTYSLFQRPRGTFINVRVEYRGFLSLVWGPILGPLYVKRLTRFTSLLLDHARSLQQLEKSPAIGESVSSSPEEASPKDEVSAAT